MNIIRKNTTLNGTSTLTIKVALKTVIAGLKGLLKLVESYERGEITEDQCLEKGEEIDSQMNEPGIKALDKAIEDLKD